MDNYFHSLNFIKSYKYNRKFNAIVITLLQKPYKKKACKIMMVQVCLYIIRFSDKIIVMEALNFKEKIKNDFEVSFSVIYTIYISYTIFALTVGRP